MVVCIRYTRHRCMCCAHVQCGVYNVYTSGIIVLLSHYRLSPCGGRYYRGEYENPQNLRLPTSSQPTTTAAGEHEPV